MPDQDDITAWIAGLKEGDSQAAQAIWNNYFNRLIPIARKHLTTRDRRVSDEEDVVLQSFDSLYRRAADGQFPALNDREDLWKLLVTLTLRKAHAHRQHNRAKKRGGGEVRGESVFQSTGDQSDFGIAEILEDGAEATHGMLLAETVEFLLESLESDVFRQIALQKLEGYTNQEIADNVGCKLRTVERKLALIRHQWKAALKEDKGD